MNYNGNAVLAQDAFWIINKKLAGKIGIDGALLLSDLCSKEKYFRDKEQLEDNYFYNEQSNIENDTSLSPHKQRKIIKKLEELKFIKTKKKGIPPKQYFKILHTNILNFLTYEDEKNAHIISNNNKDNNNKEEISNFKKLRTSPNIKISSITKYWNTLSHTRKHKENSTKTHIKINKLVTDLRKGKFYTKSFDQNFLKKNNIKTELLSKKWKREEIKEVLEKVNNLYKDEYWPFDKTKLVRSLADVLYNSTTKKSYFLMCATNPPDLLEKIVQKKVKPKDIKIYNKYKQLFKNDSKGLLNIFNEFYDKVDKLFKDVFIYYKYTPFSSYFGTDKNKNLFFEKHIEWIKKQTGCFPGLLKGQPWQHFVNYINTEYNYNIDPGKKELERIIKNFELDKNRLDKSKKTHSGFNIDKYLEIV